MAASRPLIEGKDFSVCFRIGPDPSVAVLSFHSGAGEHGALEIADALAQELGCSLYIFENTMGVYADTHTTSNNFDDPRAVAAVEYAQVAVAMHGAANSPDFPPMCTFVGGSNTDLRMAFIRRLREDGRFGAVDAVLDYPVLAGFGETGIQNRAQLGGIQCEMATDLRNAVFEAGNYDQSSRGQLSALGKAYVAILAAAIREVLG